MSAIEAGQYDLIIVGAGLSGLSLASSLPNHSILILEAEDYVGGRVCSHQLDGVFAELGAIFPFKSARLSDSDSIPLAKPLGLYENGVLYLGSDPLEVLRSANGGLTPDFDLLASFTNPYISLLNGKLRIQNQSFGDLSRFSAHMKSQIDAFHRVIHPESVNLYSPAIVGHSLVDWPCLFNDAPNASFVNGLLENLGERVAVRTGCLVSQVSPGPFGQPVVQYRTGSDTFSTQSRFCAITAPASQMLGMLKDFQSSNCSFYRDVLYASGMVCAMVVDESSDFPRYIVSTDQIWSSMIPLTRRGKTILHFYITGSQAVSLWSSSDVEIVRKIGESIRSIGLVERFFGATVRRWRELGPILSEQLRLSYYPKHYRLAHNLWFAGEMALYTPSSPLSYGMSAAIKAGKMIASDILSA